MFYNTILIILILTVMIISVYLIFFRKASAIPIKAVDEDVFTMEYLKSHIEEDIYSILRQNPEDLNLNKYETEKQKRQQTKLSSNLKTCTSGDIGAKLYVIDYISAILQRKYNINEQTINRTIRFQEEEKLSVDEKFDILLCYYIREYGDAAMHELVCSNHFDDMRNEQYYIDKNDIAGLFHKLFRKMNLSYTDKMDVLSRRIYQKLYGHGCIDRIRDMKVDGVSVGVSGISADTFSYAGVAKNMTKAKENYRFSYDSVWMLFEGKQFYLSCIGCHSQKELIRVCKNLYRYHAPKHASANDGKVTNDMKDGSRVTVARPKFADSWVAIVRKHASGKLLSLEEQLTDTGAGSLISLLILLVRGEVSFVVTGGQYCGKTTLLRRLITYIRKHYTIRLQESVFEMGLREIMQDRNVITFLESDLISGQETLNFVKKTDCDVLALGEVVAPEVAAQQVQANQTGGPMTMSTHHAPTTKKYLEWNRNALMACAHFSNERIAMEQVVATTQFDIHMDKFADGHRFCARITEIIPVEDEITPYKLVDIVVFDKEKRCYSFVNPISKEMQERITAKLLDNEKEAFLSLFKTITEVA